MILRPYQTDAVSACMRSWREHRRILLVLPTGAGKTITFAAIAQHVVDRGHKVLILAHREELLEQARDKLASSVGIVADLEKAEHRASRDAQVVVASVQSLQGDRLASWPADHFALVIIEEAHHAAAETYQNIIRHFDAKLLGVTATPDRSDKKAMGKTFEAIAYERGLAELIREGFLARPVVRTLSLSIDLRDVKSTAGDYQSSALADTLTPYFDEIIREALPYLSERKTLVFCPLIETSRDFVRIAAQAGLEAKHIDGTSEDRQDLLQWFRQAKPGSIISSAMLLTEGFDEPSADCILNLRPTKSRSLYAQMIGRALRIHPGKVDALILDPIWQCGRHNLIKPASLVATSPEQALAMEQREGDLLKIAETADSDRLAALKEALDNQRGRKSKLIDPIELGTMLNALSVADYEPCFRWQEMPVSGPQKVALEHAGIDAELVLDRGQASVILDAIAQRREQRLATPKQVRMLIRLRHPQPHSASFEEAKAFLDSRLRPGKKNPTRNVTKSCLKP